MSFKKIIFSFALLFCVSQASQVFALSIDQQSFDVIFDGSLVSSRSFTLKNDNSDPISITDVNVYGDGVIQYASDTCSRTTALLVNEECQITVNIRPIDYSLKFADLMVSYNDSVTGLNMGTTFSLAAHSFAAPRLTASPVISSGDIYLVGAFTDGGSFESRHRIRLTNTGIAAVPILDITPVFSSTTRVISHNCPAGEGLAVGASCEMILGFRPIDYSSSFTDIMVVAHSGRLELGLVFPVIGLGVASTDLVLSVFADIDSVNPNTAVNYLLKVNNSTDQSSRGPVEVSFTLPASVEFVSSSLETCQFNTTSREVRCLMAEIPAHTMAGFTYVLRPTTLGSFENVVTLYSPTDANTENNSASAIVNVVAPATTPPPPGGGNTDTDTNANPQGNSAGGGCSMTMQNFSASYLGLILSAMMTFLILGMFRKNEMK